MLSKINPLCNPRDSYIEELIPGDECIWHKSEDIHIFGVVIDRRRITNPELLTSDTIPIRCYALVLPHAIGQPNYDPVCNEVAAPKSQVRGLVTYNDENSETGSLQTAELWTVEEFDRQLGGDKAFAEQMEEFAGEDWKEYIDYEDGDYTHEQN